MTVLKDLSGCLLAILVVLYFPRGAHCAYQYEKQIHGYILHNQSRPYNIDVLPAERVKEPVKVFFDMRLSSLVGLDLRKQVLSLNTFTMLRWTDPQLKWDKKNFGGTDRINLGNLLIWTPDVVLYNTADEKNYRHTELYTTKIKVLASGEAIWRAPIQWQISCELDVTWFPVDKQTCAFTFGSNSYTKSQVDVKYWVNPQSAGAFLQDNFTVNSGEWTLESYNVTEEINTFDCCPEAFTTVKYTMVLSRMSLFYFMYIILPLISLAFLFMLVFHIPADSGERMGFGVTILLSITVYLLVISEKLPEKSDNQPMLGVCFIVVFYLLCVALGCAAATTIFSRRKKKPPQFLRNYLLRNKKNVSKVEHKASVKETNANDGYEYSMEALKTMQAGEKEEEEKKDYSDEWASICRLLDKRMFVIFNAVMVAVPIVVTIALPKTGLA